MRKLPIKIFAVTVGALALTGCCTTREVAPISLNEALNNVMDGIDRYVDERNRRMAENQKTYPYLPAEAEVTFSLGAKKTESGGVTLTVIPSTVVTAGANWSVQNVRETGSSVKIKLQNLMFVNKNQWVMDQKTNAAEDVKATMKAIVESDIVTE